MQKRLYTIYGNWWCNGKLRPFQYALKTAELFYGEYFLWGYLKNNVFATKPADLVDLTKTDFTMDLHQDGLISADMRQNVLYNFYL